ncbi:GNAT family N-acetyltransferase [Halonatronum saccharophilum]|uniref:GNAT family N-acetyltransferase n=1 Tax=Halonatronum saccharophilum TaxID=150060 RepID=UPI00048239AD|nr:N-acetyltransferase [Halonatronum saccharophilum]
MNIEIKRVLENDLELVEKLVQIEKEAFGDGGLNNWGLVPMIYHGRVYTILSRGYPIGIAEYMRDMEEPDKAYLYGLAIRSGFRGQGLSTCLLDYTLDDLKKLGIKKIELTVSPDNKGAIHLYEKKFSFKEVEYRKDEYGKREDRLIMEKKI